MFLTSRPIEFSAHCLQCSKCVSVLFCLLFYETLYKCLYIHEGSIGTKKWWKGQIMGNKVICKINRKDVRKAQMVMGEINKDRD